MRLRTSAHGTIHGRRRLTAPVRTIEYHTYSIGQCAEAAVIRGIPLSTTAETLTAALGRLGFQVEKAERLTSRKAGRRGRPLPAGTDDAAGRTQSSAESYSCVSWRGSASRRSRYRPPRGPVQCRNCLDFGHVQRHCARHARCGKCGATHDAASCHLCDSAAPRLRGRVNCGGDATALDIGVVPGAARRRGGVRRAATRTGPTSSTAAQPARRRVVALALTGERRSRRRRGHTHGSCSPTPPPRPTPERLTPQTARPPPPLLLNPLPNHALRRPRLTAASADGRMRGSVRGWIPSRPPEAEQIMFCNQVAEILPTTAWISSGDRAITRSITGHPVSEWPKLILQTVMRLLITHSAEQTRRPAPSAGAPAGPTPPPPAP